VQYPIPCLINVGMFGRSFAEEIGVEDRGGNGEGFGAAGGGVAEGMEL
jgi:hypothetical protein